MHIICYNSKLRKFRLLRDCVSYSQTWCVELFSSWNPCSVLSLILTMLCCAALLSARETRAFELNPRNRVNPRNLAKPENPARSGELCLAMRVSAGSMWNARRNIEACHFGGELTRRSPSFLGQDELTHCDKASFLPKEPTELRLRGVDVPRGRKSGARTHWH